MSIVVNDRELKRPKWAFLVPSLGNRESLDKILIVVRLRTIMCGCVEPIGSLYYR